MPYKNILVVEDEDSLRNSYRGYLKKLGKNVYATNNVMDALTYAAANPLDMCISDGSYYLTPDIEQEDETAWEKTYTGLKELHPGIRFVLVSGTKGNEEKAAAFGIEYIQKEKKSAMEIIDSLHIQD